jgi:hypothetical protein
MSNNMSDKEIEIQFALGTLSPMALFLKMLSMQNEEGIKDYDWADNRTPKIASPRGDGTIDVEISDEVVFVFNSKGEFVGTYNYKQ